MRTIIMILTVLLIAVTYTLSISQTQAIRTHVYEMSFVDSNGEVIHSDYFSEGADLSDYQLPEAPVREGYIFIGWAFDFTQTMPNADVVIYPQYMYAEYNLPATIK